MTLLSTVNRWLFRLQQDEQTPIILNQRRIFILPTGVGLLFVLVLAVMLIGAINYTLSLGHALVFLLASLGLIAMAHTSRNLLGLSIEAGRATPVFVGEIARFPLHLRNSRKETRCALQLQFSKGTPVTVSISAEGVVSANIPCPALIRGRLLPGRITLSSRYPLGLFRAWSYPHPNFSCLIYPQPVTRPLPLRSTVSDAGFSRGDNGQEDFSGLRLRNPSDSPRHIAWKAVARSVEAYPLLVKHFAGGAREELWLDWMLTADEPDDETRLSVLTGWVLAAEAAQLDYGLSLPSRTIQPSAGAEHRDQCLEALALYGYENPPSR